MGSKKLTIFVACMFFLQNTAAFWYNLKRNGEGDDRTRHAGCPILKGNKWSKSEPRISTWANNFSQPQCKHEHSSKILQHLTKQIHSSKKVSCESQQIDQR